MAEKLLKVKKDGTVSKQGQGGGRGSKDKVGRKPFIAKLPKKLQKQIMDATRAEYWAKLVTDHALPRLENIIKTDSKKPNDVQLRAIQEALNRLLGKPKDKHELSGTDGSPIQLVFYSDADSLRLGSGGSSASDSKASSQIQGDSLASQSPQDDISNQ